MRALGSDPDRRRRYEELFGDVYEPVQRYVRRRVDASLVDDVVADTMLVLWRRLDDVPVDARLAWSYGIARRCIANARRARARGLRLVERLEAQPAPVADVGHPLDVELDLALGRLDGTDQELLRLWAWEELGPSEIAGVLGLTPNAVSIRLHRARRRLEEALLRVRKEAAPSGHSTP